VDGQASVEASISFPPAASSAAYGSALPDDEIELPKSASPVSVSRKTSSPALPQANPIVVVEPTNAVSLVKRVGSIEPTELVGATYRSPSSSLIDGYADLVTSKIDGGWSGSIVTFLFDQLPTSRPSNLMRDEVHRVYSTFVTRVVRDPTRPSRLDRLPVLIGSLDLPVFKQRRDASTGEPGVNGGLHAHAILLVPPRPRLRETVADHFATNDHLYRPVGRSRIARIHVQPIDHDPVRMTEYVFKAVANRRLDYDDAVFVLPRALSEL
jgi:hypothetical protein